MVEITRITEAERIGAIVLDAVGHRLFVADTVMGRLFVVPLTPGGRTATLALPGSEEICAVAWSPIAGKVFAADAAQEAVWSVDPDRPEPPATIRDTRLREPAGLTTTRDGHLWLVDEGAKTAFLLSAEGNSILRAVQWK